MCVCVRVRMCVCACVRACVLDLMFVYIARMCVCSLVYLCCVYAGARARVCVRASVCECM